MEIPNAIIFQDHFLSTDVNMHVIHSLKSRFENKWNDNFLFDIRKKNSYTWWKMVPWKIGIHAEPTR